MNLASDAYIADMVRTYLKGICRCDIEESHVANLLESHKRLRSLNIENHRVLEKYREDMKAEWARDFKDSVIEEFIREKLKNMTLQEVANFIGGE